MMAPFFVKSETLLIITGGIMYNFKASNDKLAIVFTSELNCDNAIRRLNGDNAYNWFKQPMEKGFIITAMILGRQTHITEYSGPL